MQGTLTNRPVDGDFSLTTTKNQYWVRLKRGVIVDCYHDLREQYDGVHIKFLISHLERTQGNVEVRKLDRAKMVEAPVSSV